MNQDAIAAFAACPILDKAGAAAWITFLTAYRSYVSRGGVVKHVKELIQPRILRVLELRISNAIEMESEELIQSISALYAPKTELAAYSKFERLRMVHPASFELDPLLEFILKFTEMSELCASVLPKDKLLRKLFIKGLKPQRLSQRVELQSPDSLSEAMTVALEEAEALAELAEELHLSRPPSQQHQRSTIDNRRSSSSSGTSVSSTSSSSTMSSRQSGSSTESRSSKWKSSSSDSKPRGGGIHCYGCGQKGHKRTNCPAKGSPHWVKFGKAKPLSNKKDSGQLKALVADDAAKLDVARCRVDISAGNAVWPVTALIDSASTACFISPAVYQKLSAAGADVRQVQHTYKVADGGTVTVDTEVRLDVRISQMLEHPVEASISCGVLATGEDLLLGYRVAHSLGLFALLQETEPPEKSVDARGGAVMTTVTADDELDEPTTGDDDHVVPLFTREASSDPVMCSDPTLRREIEASLEEFDDLFGELPSEGSRIEEFGVTLVAAAPLLYQKPRRTSPAVRALIRDECKKLLDTGFIRPSRSPHAHQVVPVRKADGSLRLCVDFGPLNSALEDLAFPLPLSKDILLALRGKKFFAVLDLRTGYYQITVREDARKYLAFVTPDGQYEFTRLPFGVKTAPAYFQWAMCQVFAGLLGVSVEIYLDDIVVYGETPEEFLENLRAVFVRLREHRLRLKREKCQFGLEEITYLGHVVNANGIALSEERKQGILAMNSPKTTKQVRSFFGMANYFREFIPKFAIVTKPLTALCSTRVKFRWTQDHEDAFQAVKRRILEAPMLHHLDYDREIVLRTDASTDGVGGHLLQRVDGAERSVCFVSQAFNPTQQRWSTIEQEAYGIYFAIVSMTRFLLGHRFVVETDHRNLMFMRKSTAGKVIRWRLRLSEFNFVVRHIPGAENTVADCLSRCFAITRGSRAAIEAAHNATAGHRGITGTLRQLRVMGTTWKNMKSDVRDFVKSCPTCQKVRLRQGDVRPQIRTTAVSEPFEVLAIDTVGPLPVSETGERYIITVIDCFTRFVELRATRGATAKEAASVVLDCFGRYGAPRFLRSDQGTQFTAQVISHLLDAVGTMRQLTVPYHPEANGIVERANGEIGRHLRAIVMDRRMAERWAEALPLVQRLLNATPSSATGQTPARLLFGDAISIDRGVLFPHRTQVARDVERYVSELIKTQATIMELSRKHQERVVEKRLSESPDDPTEFAVGDFVLARYAHRAPSKLAPRWRGPLRIVGKNASGSVYTCKDLATRKKLDFTVDRLKRFETDLSMRELTAIAANDNESFVVEKIVDHTGDPTKKSTMDFKVRWQGYEPSEDTWIPYIEARDLQALDDYIRDHPELSL